MMEAKRLCLTPFTIITGGAHGSDYHWLIEAMNAGYNVIIKSFKHHQIILPKQYRDHVDIHLTNLQHPAIKPTLIDAAKILKRSVPKENTYVYNLIARNWQIANDAEAMYAIGYLNSNQQIEGGTAWSCEIFLNTTRKPFYFYDCNSNFWLTREQNQWVLIDGKPPLPVDHSACIGSRMITPLGIEAIKNIFKA